MLQKRVKERGHWLAARVLEQEVEFIDELSCPNHKYVHARLVVFSEYADDVLATPAD